MTVDAPSPASRRAQAVAIAAHVALEADGGASLRAPAASLRDVVRESWMRSVRFLGTPGRAQANAVAGERELRELRRENPIAAVFPVLDRLVVAPARDTGLVVAISDAEGRLLWVEGDADARRRAERIAFLPGADWSEAAVGTSAPGTAIASGRGVQIAGAEHFSPLAHALSCSAVPIRDPATGAILGSVDITGDGRAVAPHSLPLLQAAVAAVEAELRVQALIAGAGARAHDLPTARSRGRSSHPSRDAVRLSARGHGSFGTRESAGLRVLGRGQARLEPAGPGPGTAGAAGTAGADDTDALDLSLRHSEILVLLAHHPEGLSAARLAELLHGDGALGVTTRAELARLRRLLEDRPGMPALESRPYRLAAPIDLDAHRVLADLERGRHRCALDAYAGEVLPESSAPGVVEIRRELSSALRERVLGSGAVEAVLDYARLPEAAVDAEVLRTALRLLPPRSPKRALVVARIEALEA